MKIALLYAANRSAYALFCARAQKFMLTHKKRVLYEKSCPGRDFPASLEI
jgi:hypothetical protein